LDETGDEPMKDKEAAERPEGTSEAMRRVVDALLEGQPAPPDAQAALTEAERAEVAALARTAHFAAATLRRPDPPDGAEAAALDRARRALAARPPSPNGAPDEEPTTPARPVWRAWWDRLTGGGGDNGDDKGGA
jgi:hypothetical protein